MINRLQLKETAKAQIRGKLGLLFLITLIVYAISYLACFVPIVGGLVSLFFLTPCLSFSLVLVYMKVATGEEIAVGDVFSGFYYYWGAFKIYFLSSLFTFLWSLLFIVPGVIKAYSYSMAFYIYAENPEIGALDAIKKSQEMMEGRKMDFFVLQLSFFGWILLGYVTFFLSYIHTAPYIYTTCANFYYAIKPTSNTATKHLHTNRKAPHQPYQIGRASCRERV